MAPRGINNPVREGEIDRMIELYGSGLSWERKGNSLSCGYASSSRGFLEDLEKLLAEELDITDTRFSEHRTVLNGKSFIGYSLNLRVRATAALAGWLYAEVPAGAMCPRKFGQARR